MSPFRGVFTIFVRPIIIKDELASNIGFQCVVGQSFLRECLASMDMLTETLDVSPAFAEHACADLRVSLPCVMSKLKSADTVGILKCVSDQPAHTREELYPRRVAAPQPEAPAPRRRSRRGRGGRKLAHKRASSKSQTATTTTGSTSSSSSGGRGSGSVSPNVVLPFHPGFPQAAGPPTAAQYAAQKALGAVRSHSARTEARSLLSGSVRAHVAVNPLSTAGSVSPTALVPSGVVFPLDQLRATGRLREGFVLDLNAVPQPAPLSPAQLQSIVQQVTNTVLQQLRAAPPSGASVPSYADVASRVAVPPPAAATVPARSAPVSSLHADVRVPDPPAALASKTSVPEPAAAPAAAPPSAAAKGKAKAPVAPAAPSSHSMATRARTDASTSAAPSPVVASVRVLQRPAQSAHVSAQLAGRAAPRPSPYLWQTPKRGLPLQQAVRIAMSKGLSHLPPLKTARRAAT